MMTQWFALNLFLSIVIILSVGREIYETFISRLQFQFFLFSEFFPLKFFRNLFFLPLYLLKMGPNVFGSVKVQCGKHKKYFSEGRNNLMFYLVEQLETFPQKIQSFCPLTVSLF